jgi:hypothetical protein
MFLCEKSLFHKFLTSNTIVCYRCVKLLLDPAVQGFNDPYGVLCSDGKVRVVKPVVACWLGDREEHEMVCTIIGGNCQV